MGSGYMPDEPINSEASTREIARLERQATELDHPRALAEQGGRAFFRDLACRLRSLLADIDAPRNKA